MKKALIIVAAVLMTASFVYSEQARNIEIVDIITANTLIHGEVRVDIKFYPGGGIFNRLYVGFWDKVMIGGALNVDNLIGTGNVNVDFPPKFLGKIRFTDDDIAVPAISIGYEGEGYMGLEAKGVYISATKELNLGGIFLQLTGCIYTNNFEEFGREVDAGAGAALAITREFSVGAEYDSILLDESGRLNLNFGYFFDPIELDIGLKYGMSDKDVRLARILRIMYISYF